MQDFQTSGPVALEVQLTAGDVRITAEEREDAVVDVRPRDPGRREDVRAAEEVAVDWSDGRLLVKTGRRRRSFGPFGEGGAIDISIAVPTGSTVNGHTGLGAFRCTGALADCRMKTGLGEIDVERAGAVTLSTGLGDIALEHAGGSAELTTGSGAVRIGAVEGTAVVKSSNGAIRLGEIARDLRVKAANGDIAIDRAHASASVKTAKGDVRIGAVGSGPVVAATAFGAVDIGVPAGVAAWLDLDTHYGHVHNSLDPGQEPGPGEESVSVRARTSFGDITIRRSGS
jgi:hypothetical protein